MKRMIKKIIEEIDVICYLSLAGLFCLVLWMLTCGLVAVLE